MVRLFYDSNGMIGEKHASRYITEPANMPATTSGRQLTCKQVLDEGN